MHWYILMFGTRVTELIYKKSHWRQCFCLLSYIVAVLIIVVRDLCLAWKMEWNNEWVIHVLMIKNCYYQTLLYFISIISCGHVIPSMSVTCDRSALFSGYSGFLHQKNWPPRYSWNSVESGAKHYKQTVISNVGKFFV